MWTRCVTVVLALAICVPSFVPGIGMWLSSHSSSSEIFGITIYACFIAGTGLLSGQWWCVWLRRRGYRRALLDTLIFAVTVIVFFAIAAGSTAFI
jgi:hypothetical protein